jgi:hypothetical protein
VANKEWLAQQPLEILKKRWIAQKIAAESPDKDTRRKMSADISLSEERQAQFDEEFIKQIKDNVLPIENPEQAFPIYFKRPEQLMEIFTTLEEQNLMLIQKNQGLLKEIEEKKGLFNAMQAKKEKQYNDLAENERKLLEKTKEEQKRINEQISIQDNKEDLGVSRNLGNLKGKV